MKKLIRAPSKFSIYLIQYTLNVLGLSHGKEDFLAMVELVGHSLGTP